METGEESNAEYRPWTNL